MNITLICTDIDGTLIGENRTGIPQINKEMLRKAISLGIPVALVSGRGPDGIRPIQSSCGIEGPMGCFSGALVLDEKGNKLFGHPVEKQLALQVLSEIRKFPGVSIFQFGEEAWYKEKQGKWENFEEKVSCKGRLFPSIEDAILSPSTTVYKLLAIQEKKELMEKMQKRLISLFGNVLDIMLSSPFYLEIQTKGIGKGKAVKVLAEHYHTEVASTVVFGDYFNDIDMFHTAGTSVAMKNAPLEVQREATLVTGLASEGGLGNLLRLWLQ